MNPKEFPKIVYAARRDINDRIEYSPYPLLKEEDVKYIRLDLVRDCLPYNWIEDYEREQQA